MEPDFAQQRQQAHLLLDVLPDDKIAAVGSLLAVMVEPLSRSLAMAPVEDEELTPETGASLDRARVAGSRGGRVPRKNPSRVRHVTEGKPPARLSIIWSEEARADLRRPDLRRIDLLACTDRYLSTRNGDIKQLKPPQTGYRLGCGDYRLFFEYRKGTTIEILAVRHRPEAYR